MKHRLAKWLSLTLAALLQAMPLLRSALPWAREVFSSPTGSLILRWGAGGVALFGYHAISSASSISVSPPTATISNAYAGTVTYSGGHAGSVQSMSISNNCLGSFTLAPGLTLHYSGGNTASLTGTPTGSPGAWPFTVKVTDLGSCGGSLTDTRSTTLTIQTNPVATTVPNIVVSPQSQIYQLGASNVILSGGATGNPAPSYYWKFGISNIAGANTNSLTIPVAQLTNAGLYSLWASNSQGQVNSSCYLTIAQTAGSNILAFQYTNYVIANTPVTMSTFITNVSTANNTYAWQYQFVNIGVTTSNFTLSSAQTIPANSGTYTINFNSSVGASNVVVNQAYDSYWQFGWVPAITNQPSPITVSPGSNATFSCTLTGSTAPTVFLYQNTNTLVAQTNLASYNTNTANLTTNISFTITNVAASNAGSYTFVITNFWGSVTSSPASLTVSSPLSVSNPQGQTNYAGKPVGFSVTASGAAPLSYQWRVGAANLTNGGVISGATTNTLNINPAAVSNSGSYSIVVTNSSGSVTSGVAALSIVPVPKFAIQTGASNVSLSAPGGIVGSNYVLQVNTNLANSNGWTPILTNAVPGNGNISITDTNKPTNSAKFYRVLFPEIDLDLVYKE